MPNQFGEQKLKIESADLIALQDRITKLESQLATEQKEASESGKAEMAKQEIKEYIQEVQQTPSFASPISNRNNADEIKNKPVAEQLGALISLALESGLDKAISVAKSLNNPAILDELHDTLVDTYFNQLVQIGAIKLK
jgi:hypothetical protein